MRILLILTILIGLILLACNTNPQSVIKTASKQTSTSRPVSKERLKAQKVLMDAFFSKYKDKVTVFVKVPNREKLIEVKNEDWPEDIETTYNILKDSSGRVILFLESPYSESGDWNITFTHYFDQDGRTFAFSRQTNFFNSGCTEGVAYETINEYYNKDFQQVGKEYKLVDEKGKPLTKSKCDFPYDEPIKVKPNRDSCLSIFMNNKR